MDDWLKGYWGTQINAVVSQMTFWYFWNLFSFREGSVPPFDSWEHILNPCPWGLTKHAGTGEATDGTSIPCPGCEFMFSKLWISFHIHLFCRLPAVSCGQALYATYAFGRADETETSIHFKLLLHIQQPVRGYSVNTHGPMRNLTETLKCLLCTIPVIPVFSSQPTFSALPCLTHFCGGKPEGFTALPSSINQL